MNAERRTTTGMGVVMLIMTAILLARGGGASAHAFLVRTIPPGGARLDRAPEELVLEFTEPLESRPGVHVRTVSGAPVPGLRSLGSGDRATVRVALPVLARGVYVVAWEGVADDGHRSEGAWAFAVGDVNAATIPASRRDREEVSWPTIAANWTALLILAAAAAATLFAGRRVSRPAGNAIRAGRVVGVAAVFVLIARVQVVVGWRDAWGASNRIAALGVAGVAFGAAALSVAQWANLRSFLLSLAAATVIASGHVVGPGAQWIGLVTVVHALLGLWWIASLGGVLVASRGPRAALSDQARAHSRRALVIVPAAVTAGVATAVGRLGGTRALTGSPYGRWVIAKAALVAIALGLAFVARRSASRLGGNDAAGWVRVVSIEAVLVVAAIGTGSVLSSTAPPPPPASAQVAGELGPSPIPGLTVTVAALAGDHELVAIAGAGRLQVRLLAPGGQVPSPSTRVDLTGVEPDGTQVDWQPRTCAPGCVEVDHSWRPGTTGLHVTTRGSDGGNANSNLTVAWPPLDATDSASAALARFAAVAMVHVVETVSSGPLSQSSTDEFDLSGDQILAASPFPRRPTGVVATPAPTGQQRLRFWMAGSSTWVELRLDGRGRLVGDAIIDPGHRVERTYSYR